MRRQAVSIVPDDEQREREEARKKECKEWDYVKRSIVTKFPSYNYFVK